MTSPPNLPSPTSAWLILPLCLPLCFISYLPYLCPAWLYWLVGLACLYCPEALYCPVLPARVHIWWHNAGYLCVVRA